MTPLTLGVNEGSSNTFSVRLTAQPTVDVTVNVATLAAGDADLTVSGGAILTFTTANWNSTQDVTVAAAEDDDAVNGSAVFVVASSGLTTIGVTATEADNGGVNAPPIINSLSAPDFDTRASSIRS